MATPTRELIELRLTGRSLASHVSLARRRGVGWRRLATEISDETGVVISHTTLRRWFPEPRKRTAA